MYYVQPASHDAGTSIGAALYVQHAILKKPRSFVMRHVYWGSEYADDEILKEPKVDGLQISPTNRSHDLIARTAEQVADGKIVGWFQGRMGIWTLGRWGNRSILADPRRKDMKDILNSRIKYREPFSGPSALQYGIADRVGEYFRKPIILHLSWSWLR